MAGPDATTIAHSSEEDRDRLCRLIRNSFAEVAARFGLTPANCPKHPSNYTREWVAADLRRGVRYFILTAGAVDAGCVGVEPASSETCYLERLAVLPAYRGRGYGTLLVRRAIGQAREWNATGVEIGVIAADAGLKAFYASLGFVERKTQTFDHLPFDVAFMRADV